MPDTKTNDATVVYQLTLRADPKIYYIGQVREFRWNRGYKGSGVALKKYYELYGDNAFYRSVLRYCKTKHEALLREKCLVVPNHIDPNSLNKNWGGGGMPFMSEEVKQKIGLANTGKKRTTEQRATMAISQIGNTKGQFKKGVPLSPSHRRAISLGKLGKSVKRTVPYPKCTKEKREKIRAGVLAYQKSVRESAVVNDLFSP